MLGTAAGKRAGKPCRDESFGIARRLSPAPAWDMDASIRVGLEKTGLLTARRHLLLCVGPDCCTADAGEAVWAHIKQRLRETGLPAMRTKAACLRVCRGGPWLVVYPEGIWYGAMDAGRFDRILREHLVGGAPVEAWVAARSALDGCGSIAPDGCRSTAPDP